MVCHQSGIDAHPALKSDALDRNGIRTQPAPEGRRTYRPGVLPGGRGDLAEPPKPKRANKRRAVKDRFWLAVMRATGFSVDDIAEREGIDRIKVADGIARAKAAEEKKQHV